VSSHVLGCLEYPGIFVPLRQTFFVKTPRSHVSSPVIVSAKTLLEIFERFVDVGNF
jgi:hypothetical protein